MLPPRPNLRHLKDQAIACVNILLDARARSGTTHQVCWSFCEDNSIGLTVIVLRTDDDRSAD
jgi:hypothetical protein